MLGRCGIALGSSKDLLAPHAIDNPAGYWENIHFVRINDAILEIFGGSWMCPPKMPSGWVHDRRLDGLRIQAQQIISDLSQAPIWGWKDPRSCITLAFWQSLIPNLEYVICVREPIDVMHSLAIREHGFVSNDLALDLWLQYYKAVYDLTQSSKTVVCRYLSFAYDATAELSRVLEALHHPVLPEVILQAIKLVDPSLLRQVHGEQDHDIKKLSPELLDLFAKLKLRCGPVSLAIDRDGRFQETLKGGFSARLSANIDRLEDLYIERSQENERLRSLVFSLSTELGSSPVLNKTRTVNGLMLEAEKAQKRGDLGTAETLLQSAHVIVNEDPEPLCKLGIILALQGRPQQAVDVFQKCVTLSPNNPVTRHYLAHAFAESGQFERALDQLELICLEYPEAFSPHFDQANILLKLERNVEAIRLYEYCLQLEPLSGESMLHLGIALEGIGQISEALERFKQALKIRPNWELARMNFEHCRQKLQSSHLGINSPHLA